MTVVVTFQNQDGSAPKPASLKIRTIDKLYIVLDFHPDGERGNDRKRDIIKFVTPSYTKGEDIFSEKWKKLQNKDDAKANVREVTKSDFNRYIEKK